MARRISDRERGIQADILWFEALADEAQQSSSYQAATASRSKAVGLRESLHRLRDQRLRAPKKDDPIAVVRFSATQAEAEGSWQAAARLRSQEASLVVELRQLEAQKAAAELAGLDEAQLMDILWGVVAELPSELVAQIRDLAVERLG